MRERERAEFKDRLADETGYPMGEGSYKTLIIRLTLHFYHYVYDFVIKDDT